MTYAELRRQILNLGFETAQTYEEEPTIMVDAINRAMREITNHFPLIGTYKIAQNPPAQFAFLNGLQQGHEALRRQNSHSVYGERSKVPLL